jgi:hypothetical protein
MVCKRFALPFLVLLSAACGSSGSGATSADAAGPDVGAEAASSQGVTLQDAAVSDVSAKDVATDGAGATDAPFEGTGATDATTEASTCTPVTSNPAPSVCECFGPSSCPVQGGQDSLACLWGVTPITENGNPTCKGCELSSFPNECYRCKETFNCACLAPYLQDAGSVQQCCDSTAGPYLTEYSCP